MRMNDILIINGGKSLMINYKVIAIDGKKEMMKKKRV